MGCDGGTIPRRDELVKTKQKPEQKDKDAEAVAKWEHCAISQEVLVSPIVSCELGRLYNKDSVIEYLLNKDPACVQAKHIRNLRDIKELGLSVNTTYSKKAADLGDEYVDRQASRYVCPVVGLEMNGRQKFCFLWVCGCVLSERALKTVKTESCLKCGKAFKDEDVIILNASDEDFELQQKRMEDRRNRMKLEKKSKKHKLEGESQKIEAEDVKVKEDEPKVKRSKVEVSKASSSKVQTSSSKLLLPDRLQASFTISKDPKASEAYKSLFTTHKTALNQQKAHWVTHNPCFY